MWERSLLSLLGNTGLEDMATLSLLSSGDAGIRDMGRHVIVASRLELGDTEDVFVIAGDGVVVVITQHW